MSMFSFFRRARPDTSAVAARDRLLCSASSIDARLAAGS